MFFEAALMTFYSKSDEQIGYENLVIANDKLKELQSGKRFCEEELRDLMQKFLEAFWVYKEYNLNIAEDIASNIHSLGKILCTRFNCKCNYDSGKKMYFTACPAMLLHRDFGFSLRGIEKYKCSICGKPIIECDHITGDYYDGVKCWTEENVCNICGMSHCKNHIPNMIYNHVKAIKIPYDTKLSLLIWFIVLI